MYVYNSLAITLLTHLIIMECGKELDKCMHLALTIWLAISQFTLLHTK